LAEPVLLIFTVTAGRVNDLPLLSITPVSGARRPGFGGRLVVVVGFGLTVFFESPPPATNATMATATKAATATPLMITVTRRVRQSLRMASFTSPAMLGSARRAADAC
jgi:hypothetical protein